MVNYAYQRWLPNDPNGYAVYNYVKVVYDTNPSPTSGGHAVPYAVENTDGYNIPYMEHLSFYVTDDMAEPNALHSNVLYSHYDFQTWQKFFWDVAIDACGCGSATQLADASVVYNCHAYSGGYSGVALTHYTGCDPFQLNQYFPISGQPEWRDPTGGEQPNRAGHDYKYRDHSSIVTVENYIYYFTGKMGEAGVYKADLDWVECIVGDWGTQLKRKWK